MKVGVIGAGAVGGFFGGILEKEGHDVLFLARGKHLEVMKKNGLTIESEKGNFSVLGGYTDSYENFKDVDLVLFCVKSMDTKATGESLNKVLKKDSVILTMQNGVDNEETLIDIFGEERVLSAATYVQSFVKEPGVVKQIGIPPRLVIGALSPQLMSKAKEVVDIFNLASIESHLSENIIERKWQKLLWNVTFNPLSALMETEVKEIVDNENLREIATNVCKEAISVAQACGVQFEDKMVELIIKSGNNARNHKTSMLQDRQKGKKMEVDSICGHIIQRGLELGVNTPVLSTIYRTLKFIDSKSETQEAIVKQ